MSHKLHVLHEPNDNELVGAVVTFLGQVLPTCSVTCSHLEGHAAEAATAVLDAAAVIGVLTPGALAAGGVPFELGLARAQGKPLFAVRSEQVEPNSLSLPIPGYLIALATSPDSLTGLFRELAEMIEEPFAPDVAAKAPEEPATDLRPDTTPVATPGHATVEPEEQPLSPAVPARPVARREATEPRWSSPPVPPPMKSVAPAARVSVSPASPAPAGTASAEPSPAPQTATASEPSTDSTLPSRSDAFEAGRIFAECMLGHDEGASRVSVLDPVFGRFMTALGANWNTLKTMEDAELWVEMADNVLSGLEPSQTHLGPWYGMGFELSTLFNLASVDASGEDKAAIDEMWAQSMEKLSALSQQAQLSVATAAILEGMLENLRDPSVGRDTESIMQLQGKLKEHAAQSDPA